MQWSLLNLLSKVYQKNKMTAVVWNSLEQKPIKREAGEELVKPRTQTKRSQTELFIV